jgi:hypothetical protein
MIAPKQTTIVQPITQQAGHINLGQVGQSFVGTKQEESASNSVRQEDDKKQIPYVLNALQMQNPNGHNIHLQHTMP